MYYRVYFMLFVLSNLHMNNLSNDIVSSFADVVFLSFITLINAKTWAYELNSNFKNKSEWTLSFYEFRSEQTGSGSRSCIFKSFFIEEIFNIKNLKKFSPRFFFCNFMNPLILERKFSQTEMSLSQKYIWLTLISENFMII